MRYDESRNICDTPKVDIQQFTLALNIAENFLFLLRPYFVRAIHEAAAEPLQSPFGDAYLTVVERSNVSLLYHMLRSLQVIIQVVRGIYELYPEIAARHWFYWVSVRARHGQD